MVMNHVQIDCVGLFCPVPIIRTARIIRGLDPGLTVELLADDPGVEEDMINWCRGTGHTLVSLNRDTKGVFSIVVRKASTPG